ncbi:hypothetical protein [Natronorubrum sp. A-ect3]|uniref:hypothetical protein n=1 Tax=Natronorubrum sp. A-ect3 TaxID=3242698 RepID=UPI00359E1152
MTPANDGATVTIKFHYDQRYRQRIIDDAEPDSWIQTSISIDGTDLYGETYSRVTGFACGIVISLLESVVAAQSTERTIIEFENGPSWLTVDPIDETTVELAACHTYSGAKDPNERLDVDRVQLVQRSAWRDAVVTHAHDFIEEIIDLNPELDEHEVIAQIRSQVREIESTER